MILRALSLAAILAFVPAHGRQLALPVMNSAVAHTVVIRIEAFTSAPAAAPFTAQPVVVHLTSTPAGIQLSADPTKGFVQSMKIVTPAEVRVSASVERLILLTEKDLAVRVHFTDGASEAERTMQPWGRHLTFVRTNGDLQPQATLEPIKPVPNVR